jgi:hypothetical protein
MRLATKFDSRIVILLVLTAALTCVALPALRFLVPRSHPASLGLTFMPLAMSSPTVI